jgi:class 3 adenylate cyclase/TolB-like protein
MSPKRQRLVVMHCDIVEFSRLTSQNEDATFHAVREGFTRAAMLVSDHGGEVINTAGDSLLAVFPTALAAAHTALGLQQYFALTNRKLPETERLRARIGIHQGAVVVQGDQAFGNDVNIAARLQEAAPPAGICISKSVRDALDENLEFRFKSIGVRALRHIAEPVSAFLLLSGHEVLNSTSETAQEIRPRLLVLPFAASVHDPALGDLGEALTVDLIGALSRFRQLFVFAPHTALSHNTHDRDQRLAGQQLNARFVVDAVLRRHHDELRLVINLIEMPQGHYLWSEHYDLKEQALASTQDAITRRIVTTLVGNIEHHAGLAPAAGPASLDYDAIIRARHLVYRMRTPDDIDEAKDLFEKLCESHFTFAFAYSGLALSHLVQFLMGWASHPGETLKQAAQAARLALELDPADSGAHAAFGVTQIWQRDHDRAMDHLNRAVELNPNDADVIAARALGLIFRGKPLSAFAALESALEANPFAPAWYFWSLSISCYNSGQYRNAIDALRCIAVLNRFHRRLLAASYARLGNTAKAAKEHDRVMTEVPAYTVADTRDSQPYEHAADVDPFIEGLVAAGFPAPDHV